MALTIQRNILDAADDGEPAPGRTLEQQEIRVARPKPLAEFSHIQYALDNSEIVALYFAAAWCPMSTPITELLDQKLGDILLPPPSDTADPPIQRQGISLVYVSSDNSDDQMKSYMRKNWMAVPYESEERNNLKRRFRTCAKRELEPLKMERDYEIPTIIIISGESRQVLTYSGVADLKEHGAQAVDHWMELGRLSSALESKYDTM